MATLSKTFWAVVGLVLSLSFIACEDTKILNRGPVDHSNGVIDGEWALVRCCGGYTGDCYYPAYSGEVVVRFSVKYFEEYTDGERTATGTFEETSRGSDWVRYTLSRSDRDYTQTVWMKSSTELIIVDPCCDRLSYTYEPY